MTVAALMLAAFMLLAAVADNVNIALNAFAGVVLCAGLWTLPKYLKARDARAQLEAKDKVIDTYEQTVHSFEARVETLTLEVKECQRATVVATTEAKEWKARYEEQGKYTAEPALNEVRKAVASLQVAVTTAVQAHGDLVLEEMRQTRLVLDALARRAEVA